MLLLAWPVPELRDPFPKGGKLVSVPPMDDDLFRRARQGDREALRSLFQRHQQSLHRYIARLAGNPSDVDDLLQETFLRFLRHLPKLAPDSNVSAWLYRVATNVYLNSRRGRPPSAGDDSVRGLADHPVDGALGELLLQEIRRLPDKQRIALLLRVEEGLDYRSLAEAMGDTPENARWHVFEARRKLQERLKEKL
jgi:RNA polymerase sigma-70 factor (ECF subfamily)